MGKELALSLVIGATMGAGFKAATGQSVKQITKIGEAAAATKKALSRIEKFRELKRGIGEAQRVWQKAERQVEDLAREVRNAERPTKALTRRFEESKRAAAGAKRAFQQQSQQLEELRRDANAAGQSMRNLSQQQKQLRSVGMALGSAQRDLAAIGAQRDAVMQRRANLRGQLTDVVALGLALGAPVKAAIDFESAMADVTKALNDVSPEQVNELRRAMLDMSGELGMAADQIADITAAAGRAGIPIDELQQFTADAIKMGVAFDIVGGQAGGAMTGIRNIFKLTQEQTVLTGDAINALGNNMDAREAEILNILNRAGATSDAFGLTSNQTAALGATFLQLKTPVAVASTGINAMLNKLQNSHKQTGAFQDGLEAIGLSASEMKQMIEDDAQAALLTFLDAVRSADDVQGTLFDLFGLEYADDITKLVSGLDQYKAALATVSDETAIAGGMTTEFENKLSTTQRQLQNTKSKITTMAVEMGDRLLPAVKFVGSAVGNLAAGVTWLARTFPMTTTFVVGLGAGLMALKITSIAVGYAWTFMAGGALVAKKALVLLRVAALLANGGLMKMALTAIPAVIGGLKAMTLVLMANPIGLIVGAIAIGAALIIANWSTVKAWFSDFWSWMTGGTGSAWDAIKAVMSFSPLGLIMKAWGPVVDFLSGVLGTIGKAVSAATNFFGNDDATATGQPGATRRRGGRAAGAAVAASLAVAPAAAATPQGTTVNDSSTTSITIVQQPGEDAEALATKVERVMQRRRRGAMHD